VIAKCRASRVCKLYSGASRHLNTALTSLLPSWLARSVSGELAAASVADGSGLTGYDSTSITLSGCGCRGASCLSCGGIASATCAGCEQHVKSDEGIGLSLQTVQSCSRARGSFLPVLPVLPARPQQARRGTTCGGVQEAFG